MSINDLYTPEHVGIFLENYNVEDAQLLARHIHER